jgi:hypothetical protein
MPPPRPKEGNCQLKIGFGREGELPGWCGQNRQRPRSADPHQDTAATSQEIGATEEIPWASFLEVYLVKVRGFAMQDKEAFLYVGPCDLLQSVPNFTHGIKIGF